MEEEAVVNMGVKQRRINVSHVAGEMVCCKVITMTISPPPLVSKKVEAKAF